MNPWKSYLAVVLLGGCGQGAGARESQGEQPPFDPEEVVATEAALEGSLSLVQADGGLEGTYVLGDRTVTMHATNDGNALLDIQVEFDGMVLSGIVDSQRRVAEIDGFALGENEETQMTDDDRAVLMALLRNLEQAAGGEQLDALARLVSNWSQTPGTIGLQRTVAGDTRRAWSSICSLHLEYEYATHDDFSCDMFDSKCTSRAQVGTRYGDTYYWVGGAWTTQVQDHRSLVFETGECFGNCGANCPSGRQTLTYDCLDHDQCVRNGHSIASLWCDDHFIDASDDEVFAPRCSGT